jgi:hypothetical protein
VELKLPGGRCAIDALAEGNERDAQAVEFFEHRDEMPEIAAEAVQTPADKNIKASPFGISEKLVESGASILRATDATIYIFPALRPSTSLDVTSEFLKLVLGFLLDRRDACINGGLHDL